MLVFQKEIRLKDWSEIEIGLIKMKKDKNNKILTQEEEYWYAIIRAIEGEEE